MRLHTLLVTISSGLKICKSILTYCMYCNTLKCNHTFLIHLLWNREFAKQYLLTHISLHSSSYTLCARLKEFLPHSCSTCTWWCKWFAFIIRVFRCLQDALSAFLSTCSPDLSWWSLNLHNKAYYLLRNCHIPRPPVTLSIQS